MCVFNVDDYLSNLSCVQGRVYVLMFNVLFCFLVKQPRLIKSQAGSVFVYFAQWDTPNCSPEYAQHSPKIFRSIYSNTFYPGITKYSLQMLYFSAIYLEQLLVSKLLLHYGFQKDILTICFPCFDTVFSLGSFNIFNTDGMNMYPFQQVLVRHTNKQFTEFMNRKNKQFQRSEVTNL